MPSRDTADFCAAVQKEIRSPYARAGVARELEAHIEDRADALCEHGADPHEAELRAIRSMGDPSALGRDFDRVYSPVGYYLFLAVRPVAVLAVFLCLCVLAESWLNTRWYTQSALPHWFPTYEIAEVMALPADEHTAATGTVTGGGRYGDYRVVPYGQAALRDYDGSYDLLFAVETAHWQPWLADLSFDNMTLTSDAPQGRLYLDAVSYPSPSRMMGLHWIYLFNVDPDVRNYTVTLGAGNQVLHFQVTLGGDED